MLMLNKVLNKSMQKTNRWLLNSCGKTENFNSRITPAVFLVNYKQGKSMLNHNNKEIMAISQRAHLITVSNKKT